MAQMEPMQVASGFAELSKDAVSKSRLMAKAMREASLSAWLATMSSNGSSAAVLEPWIDSLRKAHDMWLDTCEAQFRQGIDSTMAFFGELQKR